MLSMLFRAAARSLRALACLLLLLAPAAAPAATTLTFSTSDSQFEPGVDNQGWWATGSNFSSNDNYLVGAFSNYDHRNFFTFDLTALPAATSVVSATLRLTRFNNSSTVEAVETLELFDVTTDAATLNHNFGPDAAIFADLGSGSSYGAFDVPGAGVATDVLEFTLGGAALNDIESAAGGFFSIGGMLISNNGDDFLFGDSQDGGVQELIVVIPEPATGTTLLLGLLGLAYRSRLARQT